MTTAIPANRQCSVLDRLAHCAALFVTLSAALLIAFVAVRMMELLYVLTSNKAPRDFSNVVRHVVLIDLLSFLKFLPVLFVPFLACCIGMYSTTTRYWAYGAAGTIVILLYTVMIKYFVTALVPLGADLFAYSVADMQTIIRTGAEIDAFTVGLVTLPLAIFWASLAWVRRRNPVRQAYAAVILAIGIVLHGTTFAVPAPTVFETEFSSTLASNKLMVFAEDSYAYFAHAATVDAAAVSRPATAQSPLNKPGAPAGQAKPLQDAPQYPKAVGASGVVQRPAKSPYPFLRTDATPDVLGEFFNLDPARPPNLVFVLVEGLGKAFSGPNAYLGSFTPFLDELAGKSLYWENFLAAQGRTFAVLPSVFASLPFADQGFNALGKRMPTHLSLLSILKHNGYRTKFYVGSDSAFDLDNQRLFVTRQHVDVLVSEKDYDARYAKDPDTGWGYPIGS